MGITRIIEKGGSGELGIEKGRENEKCEMSLAPCTAHAKTE